MAKNIEMNNLKSDGTYDILYPKTKSEITIIDDSVANSYSLPNGSNVSDAFIDIIDKFVMIQKGLGRIVVQVNDTNGNPMKNLIVTGLSDADGNTPVLTNSNGRAVGISSSGTVNISITGYADIENISQSVIVGSGETVNCSISVTTRNFLKVTSSSSYMFSDNVQRLDVTSVGGGGASGACANDVSHREVASGGSGAGGYCVVQDNIVIEPNKSYQAIIGSGASVGALKGGKTSFLGVEADGGNSGTDAKMTTNGSSTNIGIGGIGNGNGVNGIKGKNKIDEIVGTQGNPGTVDGFSSFTETVKYGGSGGGGAFISSSYSDGPDAAPGGGFGGAGGLAGSDGQPGQDGFGGGAGAPGIRAWFDDDGHSVRMGKPAKGGSGCVAIRMHLKV